MSSPQRSPPPVEPTTNPHSKTKHVMVATNSSRVDSRTSPCQESERVQEQTQTNEIATRSAIERCKKELRMHGESWSTGTVDDRLPPSSYGSLPTTGKLIIATTAVAAAGVDTSDELLKPTTTYRVIATCRRSRNADGTEGPRCWTLNETEAALCGPERVLFDGEAHFQKLLRRPLDEDSDNETDGHGNGHGKAAREDTDTDLDTDTEKLLGELSKLDLDSPSLVEHKVRELMTKQELTIEQQAFAELYFKQSLYGAKRILERRKRPESRPTAGTVSAVTTATTAAAAAAAAAVRASPLPTTTTENNKTAYRPMFSGPEPTALALFHKVRKREQVARADGAAAAPSAATADAVKSPDPNKSPPSTTIVDLRNKDLNDNHDHEHHN